MRSDVEKFAFSAAVNGGTLAEIELSGSFQAAVVVDIDSHGGTATATVIYVVPLEDQALGVMAGGQNIRKTIDIAANTGVYYLDRHDTAIAEPAFESVYRKIRVVADLTGAGHTITGSVYVFRKSGF